jgi:hypothetical protein
MDAFRLEYCLLKTIETPPWGTTADGSVPFIEADVQERRTFGPV